MSIVDIVRNLLIERLQALRLVKPEENPHLGWIQLAEHLSED